MYDPDEVKEWIKRAEHDFKDATELSHRRETFSRKMVCFPLSFCAHIPFILSNQ